MKSVQILIVVLRRSSGLMLMSAVLMNPTAFADGTSGSFTIQEMQFPAGYDGAQVVHGIAAGYNPDGCNANNRFVISYSGDTPDRGRAMVTAAMMAYSLGKTAKAYVNGCAIGAGGTTYPLVRILYVIN